LSFTLDCWTSSNVIAFLGITCHYVDCNWILNDVLLDFVHLKGSHSGLNMATEFLKSADELKVLPKVIIFSFLIYIGCSIILILIY